MRVCAPDCCTLIYLTKAGLLEILDYLFDKVIITNIIHDEIMQGKSAGKADAFILEKTIKESKKFEIVPVNKNNHQAERDYFRGPGEASLSVVSRKGKLVIVTSDLAAYRKFIRTGHQNIIRSDELLLMAFEKGHGDEQTFRTNLIKLKAVGGTTEQRIAFLQNQIGGKKK